MNDVLTWHLDKLKVGDVAVIVGGERWSPTTYKRVKVAKVGKAQIMTDDGSRWTRRGGEWGHGSTWSRGRSLNAVAHPDKLDVFLAESEREAAEARERQRIERLVRDTRLASLSMETLRAMEAAIKSDPSNTETRDA